MAHARIIEELIDALKSLPGIGPRSAQRIAYQLLSNDTENAIRLGKALLEATETVHRCPQCNNLTDEEICQNCTNPKRDDSKLCVVENVADMVVIEQSLSWQGRYFILMGRLSPLSGIGPTELGLHKLVERVGDGLVQEVVIATSFTPEGEATAGAITDILLKHYPNIQISRISKGVPAGAELEYTDVNTVAQAMMNRRVRENK